MYRYTFCGGLYSAGGGSPTRVAGEHSGLTRRKLEGILPMLCSALLCSAPLHSTTILHSSTQSTTCALDAVIWTSLRNVLATHAVILRQLQVLVAGIQPPPMHGLQEADDKLPPMPNACQGTNYHQCKMHVLQQRTLLLDSKESLRS